MQMERSQWFGVGLGVALCLMTGCGQAGLEDPADEGPAESASGGVQDGNDGAGASSSSGWNQLPPSYEEDPAVTVGRESDQPGKLADPILPPGETSPTRCVDHPFCRTTTGGGGASSSGGAGSSSGNAGSSSGDVIIVDSSSSSSSGGTCLGRLDCPPDGSSSGFPGASSSSSGGAGEASSSSSSGGPDVIVTDDGLAYHFVIHRGPISFTTTSLAGQTDNGDTVEAVFTVPDGVSMELSLVAYTALQAHFDVATASLQGVHESATDVFPSGTYSMLVHTPGCHYQVAFVRGAVIQTLGTDGWYDTRLLSEDFGGDGECGGFMSQVAPGNVSCPSGMTALRIRHPENGTSTLGDYSVTISNFAGGSLAWSASAPPQNLRVKAGAITYVFSYAGLTGGLLVTPMNAQSGERESIEDMYVCF